MNYVVREVSDVQGDAVDPGGILYIDTNLSGVEPGYTKVSTCSTEEHFDPYNTLLLVGLCYQVASGERDEDPPTMSLHQLTVPHKDGTA